MKSLVGNGKDFEFNSKINLKPMEILKYKLTYNSASYCPSDGISSKQKQAISYDTS